VLPKRKLPMTRKQKIRIALIIMAVILTIIAIERIYNMKPEFHVTASNASDYGIIDAKLTTREKLEDFEYLCSVLEDNYPFFEVNKRLHNIDWLGNKRKYKRLIRNTKNDAEFLIAMHQILSDLNNWHVNILGGNGYRSFYKSYYDYYSSYDNPYRYMSRYSVFSNPHVRARYKFYGITSEFDNTNQLYSDTQLETKILIDDEVAYMKFNSMGGFDVAKEDHKKIKEFLREVQNYEKLIIDIRGNGGGYDSYWKYIVSLLTNKTLSQNYYAFFKDSYTNKYIHSPYLVEDSKSINLLDEETLAQFPEEVKTDFDYYKLYRITINPLTVNTNSSDYIDFKGKVYLLVDSQVFSSAEKFASFAKDTGFATLVGETTGGDRVFEEIPLFFLPKSKFVIRYSRELGINADGTINMETRTKPHIEVDPTPHEDFTKDKCIQAAIND